MKVIYWKEGKRDGAKTHFIIFLEQDSPLCRTVFLSTQTSVVSWRRCKVRSSSTSGPQGRSSPGQGEKHRMPGQETQNCCSSRLRVQWSVENQRWKKGGRDAFWIEPWRMDRVSTQRWWMVRDKDLFLLWCELVTFVSLRSSIIHS